MKKEEIDIWYRDIGLLNKIILRCFNKKIHIARLLHPIFRFCLNIELPQNIDGLRLPHPYNIVIMYPQSVIVGNIIIGQNSIIGAGSVVVKDIPQYSVVAGNPAKVIGSIE